MYNSPMQIRVEEDDPIFQAKKEAMEKILGKMYYLVGHAIVPF